MVYVDPKYLAELESYIPDANRYRYWRNVGITINWRDPPTYGEDLDKETDYEIRIRLP